MSVIDRMKSDIARVPGRRSATREGGKLTYDDFVQFPDGRRHELIDGEHYVTPSPDTKHQTVSVNLTVLIGSWLERHPIGRLFHAPFDVVFFHYDVVEPDLLYLSNARAADALTPKHVRGVPSVSSRLNRLARASATRRSSDGSTSERASPSTGWSIPRTRRFACIDATAMSSSKRAKRPRRAAATCSRPLFCLV